ncbi:CvpA family protein [Candidatus Parcubacteria bacterium]|nr:CvpA family protein [Candidatus Parcubacteria bacterium]
MDIFLHPIVVDVCVVVMIALYIYLHVSEGFFWLTEKLTSLVFAACTAFLLYNRISHFISNYFTWPTGIMDAISFLIIFMIVRGILKILLTWVFSFIPPHVHYSKTSRILAILPALIDGLILTSLILFILVVLPFFQSVKKPIENSHLGNALVNQASDLEVYLDRIFGQATQETLGFLTVEPEEGTSLKLPFTATRLSVDEESETRMLELINEERAKVGARPLVMDKSIVAVARAHSSDMWQRSYFAHTDPDGNSPFDRMRKAGITFGAAGENLALARTVERAHEGLMNSPGHKKNILDPAFRRVGIGVVDGGIYGKMFTQDFSD